MSTITKQEVQAVADLKAGYTLGHADVAILNKLARIALASLEAEGKIPDLSQVVYHFRDWNEGFPIERFKADYVISWMLANYPPAQPTAVSVPDEVNVLLNHLEDVLPDGAFSLIDVKTWNKVSMLSRPDASSAAMLQEAK